MAREQVDGVELLLGLGRHTAGAHELQGALDAYRELFVAPALGARCDELTVPRMDAVEVGEAAFGEGAKEVQRGCRVVVRIHEALRIRAARRFGEGEVVDDVAAKRRQRDAVDRLGRGRARFRVLPRDAAHLHHGHAGRVGECHRHLEDHAELLADVVGAGVERLGTVAGLQQERLAPRHLCQLRGQRAGLTGEDQRRPLAQGLDDAVELGIVGPLGLLHPRIVPPDRRCPRCSGVGVVGCGGVPHGERIPGATVAMQSESACTLRARTRGDAVHPAARTASALAMRCGQAASMLAAAAWSRTALTARLTRRRAASAVTPSSSPTSR